MQASEGRVVLANIRMTDPNGRVFDLGTPQFEHPNRHIREIGSRIALWHFNRAVKRWNRHAAQFDPKPTVKE